MTSLQVRSASPETNIESLAGLQYATNLKRLLIINSGDGTLSDLTPISGLTALESLTINNASVSDLTPLSGLTNLNSLQMTNNKIRDISPLANCKKLSYLELSDNLITNIDTLSQLTNLTALYIMGPNANNIGGSEAIGNSISDLSPLANLTNLKVLYAGGYYDVLSDISPLAGLVHLESLVLFDNSIVDASAIENMSELRNLTLEHNDIQILPDMSKLVSLEWLKLNDNPHLSNENIEKVGQAVNIDTLFIGNANGWSGAPEVTDITPLANLNKLYYLHIRQTGVSDVSPLAELPLRLVNLDENKITDISMLHLSEGGNFTAKGQNILLPDGYVNTPTSISIADRDGSVPAFTWATAGDYANGKLAWQEAGFNQVTFSSADSSFTGTVSQTVQPGEAPEPTPEPEPTPDPEPVPNPEPVSPDEEETTDNNVPEISENNTADDVQPGLPVTGTYEFGFMIIGAILIAAGGFVFKRRK